MLQSVVAKFPPAPATEFSRRPQARTPDPEYWPLIVIFALPTLAILIAVKQIGSLPKPGVTGLGFSRYASDELNIRNVLLTWKA